MVFRLRVSRRAQQQLDDFAMYLRDYSEDFALEQFDRLNTILSNLTISPHTWSYFLFTGAPYRAYLFRVGRRTQYWIIYTIDDETQTVNVLHFWNSSRDPETFDLR